MYEGAAPGSANPEPTPTPQVKQYTEDEIIALKNSSAAQGRKDAEAKLKDANDRLIALEAKEKEREENELSEIELLKKKQQENDDKLTDLTAQNTKYKEADEAREKQILEKVEKEMEELTEEQKASVDAMPLIGKLDLIAQFKTQTVKPGDWAKGGKTKTGYDAEIAACKTHKEVEAVNLKYHG